MDVANEWHTSRKISVNISQDRTAYPHKGIRGLRRKVF